MTVEQIRDEGSDQFPVGMRVLAVDDDPICLKVLETLLIKCQYHVTTTNQSIEALKMLRKNKHKFDLVISDVQMPDMDGFKLLELVGLEMDLPVIMLSANGDSKLVMKGIAHGACDYLVKPVRMEELKNIWQHVVRKKFDSRDRGSNSQDKNAGERNGTGCGNSDLDTKHSKKRKDQDVDDDDEEEDDHENDDPSSQKKPRVVWSVELHRKFVAAVNQLGLDKAVPKKILELMNVEKLTRENVASHLQKYRLYLKRISSVANQQANMVAALGGPDSPYLRMNTMNFHSFNGSPQFQNNSLRSIPPHTGVLGRLNTPTSMGLHGLSSSSSMVQLGHGQIPRSSFPSDQDGIVLQGRPTSLEFDHLQPKKSIIGGVETNDNSRSFSVTNNFSGGKNTVVSGSSSTLLNLPNSSLTMQGRSQGRPSHETFGIPTELPPNLLDHNRCNSNNSWPTAIQSLQSSITSMDITLQDISITMSGQNQLQNSRLDTQCQPSLMGDNNMVQNMSYAQNQVWEDHKLELLNHPEFVGGLPNTSMSSQGGLGCMQVSDAKNTSGVLHRNAGYMTSMAQPVDSIPTESSQTFDNQGLPTAMKLNQGQFMDHGRPLGNYAGNGVGCLEDFVTAMFKQEQEDNIEGWRFGM